MEGEDGIAETRVPETIMVGKEGNLQIVTERNLRLAKQIWWMNL